MLRGFFYAFNSLFHQCWGLRCIPELVCQSSLTPRNVGQLVLGVHQCRQYVGHVRPVSRRNLLLAYRLVLCNTKISLLQMLDCALEAQSSWQHCH